MDGATSLGAQNVGYGRHEVLLWGYGKTIQDQCGEVAAMRQSGDALMKKAAEAALILKHCCALTATAEQAAAEFEKIADIELAITVLIQQAT